MDHINAIARIITEDPYIFRESIEDEIRKYVPKHYGEYLIDSIIQRVNDPRFTQIKGLSLKWVAKQIIGNPELVNDGSDWAYIVDYLRANPKAVQTIKNFSFNEVLTAAEQWHQQLASKQKKAIKSAKDTELVHDFGNGYKLVELLTQDAFNAEGDAMGHCCGQYAPSEIRILSLRDNKNQPHVTLGMNNFNIIQFKGKNNEPPANKYALMIHQWLDANYQFPAQYDSEAIEDYIKSANAETITKLMQTPQDITVTREVARNPNTPVELLQKLAIDENNQIRMIVARNPSTPPETLFALSQDKMDSVRNAVSGNLNAPAEALQNLAKSADPFIVSYVAEHPNTPLETLYDLADHDFNYVRGAVGKNPNATPELMLMLAANDSSMKVQMSVLKKVQMSVLANKSITRRILKILARSHFMQIRHLADALLKGQQPTPELDHHDMFGDHDDNY